MISTFKLLDGKSLAHQIRQNIRHEVNLLREEGKPVPTLAVIVIGDNPASAVYVRSKRRACEEVGFHSLAYDLPSHISQAELLTLIEELNANPQVDGILLQLPLPPEIDGHAVLEAIHPQKDVDGFHPYNLGRLAQRRPLLRPCTPYGIIKLLQHAHINLMGKHAVIVGASNIVGRPMALELLLAKCTVTVCHRFTENLAQFVGQADILISAMGKRGIIQSEWLKKDVVVIDVGQNRLEDGRMVGDLDFDTAKEKAAWITPVPGGVGPMTVTMLLKNTLQAYHLRGSRSY